MIKNIEQKPIVRCYYHLDGASLDECEVCALFGGWVKNQEGERVGCDCLRSDIPRLNNVEVLKFKSWGKTYERRTYNDSDPVEREKVNVDEDGYANVCDLCCFNRLIKGEDRCLLVGEGVSHDYENNPFSCICDHYWVEVEGED